MSLTPTSGLLDSPLSLKVESLEPGVPVAIQINVVDVSGRAWVARSKARADDDGVVERNVSPVLAGLRIASGKQQSSFFDEGLFPPAGLKLRISAATGGEAIGVVTATRRLRDPLVEIQQLTLAEDGIVARYWTRPEASRRTPIVLLGGSEGGYYRDTVASLLAAHGYPVLQLAYFGVAGLPSRLERIPLEYVHRAVLWLRNQPVVDAERLTLVGGSRGAELALLVASRFPSLVFAVAAYAPSSVVNRAVESDAPAWTHQGRPVPYLSGREGFTPTPTNEPQAVIPVERIRGRILLVSAVADEVWPSASFALAIVDRLNAHGRANVTSLTSHDAGHGVVAAIPYLSLPGGIDPGSDARARTAAWFKLLDWLELPRLSD